MTAPFPDRSRPLAATAVGTEVCDTYDMLIFVANNKFYSNYFTLKGYFAIVLIFLCQPNIYRKSFKMRFLVMSSVSRDIRRQRKVFNNVLSVIDMHHSGISFVSVRAFLLFTIVKIHTLCTLTVALPARYCRYFFRNFFQKVDFLKNRETIILYLLIEKRLKRE